MHCTLELEIHGPILKSIFTVTCEAAITMLVIPLSTHELISTVEPISDIAYTRISPSFQDPYSAILGEIEQEYLHSETPIKFELLKFTNNENAVKRSLRITTHQFFHVGDGQLQANRYFLCGVSSDGIITVFHPEKGVTNSIISIETAIPSNIVTVGTKNALMMSVSYNFLNTSPVWLFGEYEISLRTKEPRQYARRFVIILNLSDWFPDDTIYNLIYSGLGKLPLALQNRL